MRLKRYDGWNLHRYVHRWHCRDCGRTMYESDYAWYYGIAIGPYCDRCKEALKEEQVYESGVLTDNP